MKKASAGASKVSVRVARERDLRSIVQLKDKLDKYHELPGLWPPEGGRRRIFARYRQILRQRTARLFVAERLPYGIVGYLTVSVQTRRCPDREFRRIGIIAETFVERKHRRHGVGTSLVEAAARFFSGQRIRHVTLRNAVINRVANEFWEGLSFEPVLHTRTTTLKRLTRAVRKREFRA